MVILPPEAELPNGTEVEVIVAKPGSKQDPFLAAVEKAAKPRGHWPGDYALNHGHYVSGEPRKE
jgi:hypothetical protein